MSDTVLSIIIIATVATCAGIYYVIKEKLSSRKAESGVDKIAFKKLMDTILNPEEQWTTMFAYFNNWEKKGRTITTYYYYYGIAFKDNELLVIPVSYGDGVFSSQEPMRVDRADLSKVEYNEDAECTEFFDKNGERILAFLSPKITSNADEKECPVAINQTREVKAYFAFIKMFAIL